MDKSSHTKLSKETYQQLAQALPDYKEALKVGVELYIEDLRRICLEALMYAEANDLAGLPHQRIKDRQLSRWGTEKGKAIVNAGKIEVTRPRIRKKFASKRDGEIHLETYRAMNRADLIDGPLTAAVLSGVSARVYANLMCNKLNAVGVKKSSVSRKTIAATKPMVDEFFKRRLEDINAVVLFIDGVNVAGRQALACIAIDTAGRKHVCGVRLGSTENQIVCRDMIRDMIERGLDTERNYLFVIDGSKALAQAIRATFGQHTHIQRCQEHKIRDVQAYLPHKYRKAFRQKMQAAYAQKTERAALNRLNKIRMELTLISERAANALIEGMYETVTVHRLGVTGLLRQSLRTTNIIESAFSSVRRYMGRVGRFRDDAQRDLWLVRSLIEAERHFRTIEGYRQLSELRKILGSNQASK
jgi:transposase-like protein